MTNLARKLGFTALIFYGVGDILGAGIYALVGKVVALAGVGAYLSFALAGLIAAFTALSYAELSSRIPAAAGAAAFVKRAFPGRFMATLTGVFVLGTGLSSTATVTAAFSGYLQELITVPDLVAQVILLLLLSGLSFWGILHSSRVNIVLTLIEFSGLLLVVGVGLSFFEVGALERFWELNRDQLELKPVFAGMTIAYFAFVGFEDLCNLADEAKNPGRDIPRAILIALGLASVLYLLVTLTLQLYFPVDQITQAKTPLFLVFEKANLNWILRYFSVVAMLAIANTGLANLIMSSRLLYGMSKEGLIPSSLRQVHASRQTPWLAIIVAFGIALFLVLTGGVKILAQTTSLLVLLVFTLVHLSLIKIKLKKDKHTGFQFPLVVPLLGILGCLGLILQFPAQAFLRTLIFLSVGVLVWEIQRKKRIR